VVVYRSHSNWDALPVDGVPDQAVAALGIEGLEVYAWQRFFKVHQLPAATTVRDLARRAGRGLGYPGCRVFGDVEKQIRRFAFLIGGFGENQVHMPQAAMAMGAEALIIGEMSEFITIAALEMGMPVIETLHSVSESPAIRRQARMLAARLPDLPVQYVASGALAFSGVPGT
jgi:putative NIF3 family GTP cyclohydrolase 1 type 2